MIYVRVYPQEATEGTSANEELIETPSDTAGFHGIINVIALTDARTVVDIIILRSEFNRGKKIETRARRVYRSASRVLTAANTT